MDMLNRYANRLMHWITRNASAGDRSSAELAKFSASKNVRVENAAADPNYSTWSRTNTGTPPTDDPLPNATPPAAETLWDLSGFYGIHGHINITGGIFPTISLELWCLDPTNNYYFKVEEAHTIRSGEEFRFGGNVRGRVCFLRMLNILDPNITSIRLVACPE